MKILKRFLLAFFILIFLIVAAAIAVPYFFKDDILDYVERTANKELDAEISFGDVDLSLIRSFPNFSFGLKDALIQSTGEIQMFDTIASIGELYLQFDFLEVFKNPSEIEFHEIRINHADINLHIDENGKANYMIYSQLDTSGTDNYSESSYQLKNINLKKYSLNHSHLKYIDHANKIKLEIDDLNHAGKGNFDLIEFLFETETNIGALSFNYNDVAYLKQAAIKSELNILADMGTNSYTFDKNYIQLNELILESKGNIRLAEEHVDLDLSFLAPNTDFGQLISLIPSIYQKQMEDVSTKGSFQLNGEVKGQLGPGDVIPAFNINAQIKDGYFKYADVPKSINNVMGKILVDQPGNSLDAMIIDISPFSFNLDKKNNSGNLRLSKLISNPKIVGSCKGSINFAELKDVLAMEDLIIDGGDCSYDINMDFSYNQIENEEYEEIDFNGKVLIDDFLLKYANYPQIQLSNTYSELSPREIDIERINLIAGESDFYASMRISNPLKYLSSGKPHLVANIRSKAIYGDEWITSDTGTEAEISKASFEDASTEPFILPMTAEISFSGGIVNIMDYTLNDLVSKISLSDDALSIQQLNGIYEQMPLTMRGSFKNLTAYLNQEGKLDGSLSGTVGTLDLNPFLSEGEATESETSNATANSSSSDFLLPEDMNLSLDFKADQILLMDYELQNAQFNGQLVPSKFIIEQAKGNSFGGELGFKGIFETPKGAKPILDLEYNMKDISFQKIFTGVAAFEKLAPFAKYINGNFNLDLDLATLLNEDLGMDFNSINAKGFLQTLNAVVEGYEPLNNASKKYGLPALKDLKLDNTKNWLSIENGKVYIEEFEKKISGNSFYISGNHSIDQLIDYKIKTSVPQSALDKTGLTKALDPFIGKAEKLGIKWDQNKAVDVQFSFTGALTKPKIDFKILGLSDGQGGESKSVKEDVTENIKDKVNEEKEALEEKIRAEKEKREKELKDRMEKEKEKLEAEKRRREEELKEKLAEEKRRAEEELKRKAEKEKKKIKDKLKDLNPF